MQHCRYSKNGKVLAEVKEGIHGIRQDVKISCSDLKQYLKLHVYFPENYTSTLHHYSSGLTFTLIVDDFGIKHTNVTQSYHLIK